MDARRFPEQIDAGIFVPQYDLADMLVVLGTLEFLSCATGTAPEAIG